MPLWHAHQSCDVSALNCTVQSRCVHTALNARTSPSAVRTTMPGLAAELENHAGVRLQRRRALPATTLAVAGSPLAGGIEKARDRIGDRHRRRHEADAEQGVEKRTPLQRFSVGNHGGTANLTGTSSVRKQRELRSRVPCSSSCTVISPDCRKSGNTSGTGVAERLFKHSAMRVPGKCPLLAAFPLRRRRASTDVSRRDFVRLCTMAAAAVGLGPLARRAIRRGRRTRHRSRRSSGCSSRSAPAAPSRCCARRIPPSTT